MVLNEAIYKNLRYPDQIPDEDDALPNTPGIQVQVYPAPGPNTPKTYSSPPKGVLFQTKRRIPATFPATYDPAAKNPGARTTPWMAQYDRSYLLETWTGHDAIGAQATPARTGGGFFPNIHNNYIRTALHQRFGQVAVITGKIPTSPSTSRNTPRMGRGQVRYTSFCINESVRTTHVMDCAHDEKVPADSHGNYRIVVSLPGDRPSNATPSCGVAFIERSSRGDGYKDPGFGWFQIRNMLPDTGFEHAVQNTKVPGDEVKTMGDHLPNVTYMSKAQFQAQSCTRH